VKIDKGRGLEVGFRWPIWKSGVYM